MGNSKLLYFTSVATGSSFTAIEIFNSNLFGLDIFYMGLSRKHWLSFSAKRVYSIIAFENVPQLILSIWFTFILGSPEVIPLTSMTFSTVSIVVMVISLALQKRINKTQNEVYISFDVIGKSVMDNIDICEKRKKSIKKYLCRYVFVINEKSLKIMKPFIGPVENGLQLQIYISCLAKKSYEYENKLIAAVDHESQKLKTTIKDEWNLSELPAISNISCEFKEAKLSMSEFAKIPKQSDDEGELDTLKAKNKSLE